MLLCRFVDRNDDAEYGTTACSWGLDRELMWCIWFLMQSVQYESQII